MDNQNEIKLYLVHQWNSKQNHYEIRGIFTSIDKAVEVCIDKDHCYVEYVLDKDYGFKPIDLPSVWPKIHEEVMP